MVDRLGFGFSFGDGVVVIHMRSIGHRGDSRAQVGMVGMVKLEQARHGFCELQG